MLQPCRKALRGSGKGSRSATVERDSHGLALCAVAVLFFSQLCVPAAGIHGLPARTSRPKGLRTSSLKPVHPVLPDSGGCRDSGVLAVTADPAREGRPALEQSPILLFCARTAKTLRLRGGGRILRCLYATYRRRTSDLPAAAVDVLLQWGVREQQLPADVRSAVAVGTASAQHLDAFLSLRQQGWGGPVSAWLCKLSPVLRDRIVADSRFTLLLLTEVLVGCGSKLAAQLLIYGGHMWRKLDRIVLGLGLEFLGDVCTVCLFAPTLPLSQTCSSRLSLRALFLPQVSPSRSLAASLVLQGARLFCLSFAICWLSEVWRQMLDAIWRAFPWGRRTVRDASPGTSGTGGNGARSRGMVGAGMSEALSFACFMATSTNVRLHLLASAEACLRGLSGRGARGPSWMHLEPCVLVTLRFFNSCMGGVSWLAYKHLLAQLLSGSGA